MNILFIIDPLETLHLETDTTFIIMAEAKRRGYGVWTATLKDLFLKHHVPFCKAEKFSGAQTREWQLANFQIIFMRKDPPFSIDYIAATSMLSLVDPKKTFILNHPAALRNFNEKLGILQFPDLIPPSIVSKRYEDFIAFLKKHKKIVLKPLEGFAGEEIIILEQGDKNRNALLEMLTRKETRYLMAQRYLPAVRLGDKRVLILNGKILGQQNRVAHPSDHRSNISAGGSSHRTRLTTKERRICETVAKTLLAQGIYFAGIDLIGGFVTEINVTSPTGLVKINEHEKAHLEKKVLDFLEKKSQ
ncbi:glutathione synthase [Candidatus Peregrinibacteria bacterium]|nr:glutathione synthase [Candidatus Peregrinibacteria bacterium]